MNTTKRVLSIQSHVVSGYVGNKSATFPLQVLGFDVDAVNSVQLSNHTGYKIIKGQVLQAAELKDLYEGLKENGIDSYSHLLTGYCGSESFLKEIINVFKSLKQSNPNLIYVCDPVMGDNGKYYVPKILLPIYRDELIPLADVITPNDFEAELLSGVTINTEKDAYEAMRALMAKGPKTVVLTSTKFDSEQRLVLLAASKDMPDKLYIRIDVPRLDAVFTGTGDLFASMLLAWLHEYPNDLKLACEKTMSAIQAILHKTLAAAREQSKGEAPNVAQIELRLVQSLDIIRSPEDLFKADVVQIE